MSDLIPVEQKEVDFYGDGLTAVRASDGEIYVSIRHMCDALDLNVQAQTRRIKRHTIMADGFMVAKMATIKGDRPANWIRVDLVPLWLAGLSTKSVTDESLRERLERYQRKAANVLWRAFRDGSLTTNSDGNTDFETQLKTADPNAVEAYNTALAIMKLAKSHIMLEGRIDSHERQLRFHDTRLEDVEGAFDRLEDIESALGLLGDDPLISEAQASQISQGVKAVAVVLAKSSGRNEFGGVYGQLYRRYSVSGYKMLPARQFRDAMEWLANWLAEVNG